VGWRCWVNEPNRATNWAAFLSAHFAALGTTVKAALFAALGTTVKAALFAALGTTVKAAYLAAIEAAKYPALEQSFTTA
jgi:hypothetical protein